MVNTFTMSLTETKPTSRSLKLDKQKQEQERREAMKREIAKNNPKIDNNIVKGYNQMLWILVAGAVGLLIYFMINVKDHENGE